jgi:hypothetical protein
LEAYVEIQRSDGSTERHRLEGEKITVGRSPAATICLPSASELEAEHVMLAPRPDGCWVALARGARVSATHKGSNFEQGMIPWGGDVQIGPYKLVLTEGSPQQQASRRTSPVAYVALIAIPLAAWMLLSEEEEDLPDVPTTPPPALFADPAPCAFTGAPAAHRARESAEAANAKAERYPFEAQDGVEAVSLYGIASSCYAAAGQDADAQRMTRERDLIARRLDEDYVTHRLRLERALKNEQPRDALAEARALKALTRHLETPYVTWITMLERRLTMRVDAIKVRR